MLRRDGTRTLRVADGRWVWLRPIRRGDLPALNAMLMGLSPRSRRLRFHGAVNALPCSALRDLAALDDEHHATLVAQAYSADGIARLVAEARWVRDAPGASSAEFALSVADDWHRRGLARALLESLCASAAAAGVQRLYGSVLDENHGMLKLLASQGARPRRDPRGGWGVVWMLEIGAVAPATAEPARLPSRFPVVPAPAR